MPDARVDQFHSQFTNNKSLPSPRPWEIAPSRRAIAAELNPLKIQYCSIESLTPYANNARTHSKSQKRKIRDSIKEFGFVNPVLIDRSGRIIAGHGRVEGAKLCGMTEVPTICLADLSPDQIRAYVIADNRLAEDAGWDPAILKIELQHLLTLGSEFDITITGFEVPEVDLLLQEIPAKDDPDDSLELMIIGPPVTRPGDLWLLGKHRIFCGSALDPASFSTLMEGRRAHMVFADPPYNVAIEDNVSGKGAVKHADFAMACGEMSEAAFTDFLTTSMCLLAQNSSDGSIHFICTDWRHQTEMLAAGRTAYDTLTNICVWAKNTGGLGSFYRSAHEFVYVFKKGLGRHQNNIMLGVHGRYRTNVWTYPAKRGLAQQQSEEGNLLAIHPTVKPTTLVSDAILDVTARGNLVLDSFLGSGKTVIAAERTGRVCYGIELEAHYVDAAVRRWQRHTGDFAIHAESRKRFEHLAVTEGRNV